MIKYLTLVLASALLSWATPATAQERQPITATQDYPDKDGDGQITSSGKFKELGPKGTCWVKKGGLLLWPCGYEPPKPALPVVDLAKANHNGAIKWTDCGKADYHNAYRLIGVYSGATVGTCNGLVGHNIGRSGIEIRGDDVVVSNATLIHGPVKNVSPDLPEGVQVKSGKRVLIKNVYAEGFEMKHIPGKYDQGDDFVVESGVQDVHFQDVTGKGAGDSNFDILKGDRITGDNMVGIDAGRCLKIGALNVHLGRVTCSGSRNEAVVVYDTQTLPELDLLTYDFTGQTWPINLIVIGKQGAGIKVGGCAFKGTAPVGSKMVAGPMNPKVSIPASCKLP